MTVPEDLHIQFISFAYAYEHDIVHVAELLEFFILEGLISVNQDVLALQCRIYSEIPNHVAKAFKAFRILAHLAQSSTSPGPSVSRTPV
ncbi:MAG: hypothetical protein Q7V36_03565, partial [Deltaproteobacteria bacterium]|nr:hypothetical protein [Deltaproteobacteria bacterium]